MLTSGTGAQTLNGITTTGNLTQTTTGTVTLDTGTYTIGTGALYVRGGDDERDADARPGDEFRRGDAGQHHDDRQHQHGDRLHQHGGWDDGGRPRA